MRSLEWGWMRGSLCIKWNQNNNKKGTKDYVAPKPVTDENLNNYKTILTVSLLAQQMNKFLEAILSKTSLIRK